MSTELNVIVGAVGEVTASITRSTSNSQDIADRAESTFKNLSSVEETARDNINSVTKLNNLVRKFDVKL